MWLTDVTMGTERDFAEAPGTCWVSLCWCTMISTLETADLGSLEAQYDKLAGAPVLCLPTVTRVRWYVRHSRQVLF